MSTCPVKSTPRIVQTASVSFHATSPPLYHRFLAIARPPRRFRIVAAQPTDSGSDEKKGDWADETSIFAVGEMGHHRSEHHRHDQQRSVRRDAWHEDHQSAGDLEDADDHVEARRVAPFRETAHPPRVNEFSGADQEAQPSEQNLQDPGARGLDGSHAQPPAAEDARSCQASQSVWHEQAGGWHEPEVAKLLSVDW